MTQRNCHWCDEVFDSSSDTVACSDGCEWALDALERHQLRVGSVAIGEDWCVVSLYGDDGPTAHIFKRADLKRFAEELLALMAAEEERSE